MICRFNIKPVPKGRPRLSKWGTYTPKATKDFESALKKMAIEWLNNQYDLPVYDCPIRVILLLTVKRPKKTKLEYPKPDVDNYTKSVLDALNGIFWSDDSNIIDLHVMKAWGDDDMIEIHVLS